MMKRIAVLIVGLILLSGCSNIAIVSSGSSLALSNNAYAKAYSGIDLATTLTTKKDIKTHAYEYVVKARKVKEVIVRTIYHDFDTPENDLITTASSVERGTIFQLDESIKLASTKAERITITIDVFKLCYLSFFLAVSIVLLMFSLIYLLIHCTSKPIKVVKKRKYKIRKRK